MSSLSELLSTNQTGFDYAQPSTNTGVPLHTSQYNNSPTFYNREPQPLPYQQPNSFQQPPAWAMTVSVTFQMVMTALQCACEVYMAVYGTINTVRMIASLRKGMDQYRHSTSLENIQTAVKEFQSLHLPNKVGRWSTLKAFLKGFIIFIVSVLLMDSLYRYMKKVFEKHRMAQMDELRVEELAAQIANEHDTITRNNIPGASLHTTSSLSNLHTILTNSLNRMHREDGSDDDSNDGHRPLVQNDSVRDSFHSRSTAPSFIFGSISNLICSAMAMDWIFTRSTLDQQSFHEDEEPSLSDTSEDDTVLIGIDEEKEEVYPTVSYVNSGTIREFPNNSKV